MSLKRTNWTTEEVIRLLDGQKLCAIDSSAPESVHEHNEAVDNMKAFFGDFLLPETEMGACAYDPEKDRIYHIGPRSPR